jgi:hypothetical protein
MKQKQRLINCYEAADLMGCGVKNVWALIRRLSLKAVRKNDKLLTCEEWIEEYQENKRSKDLHSTFNGRKVFDSSRGELSMNMIADALGVHKTMVMYYIKTGRLRSTRKGAYHVILDTELERFKAEELEHVEEKQA